MARGKRRDLPLVSILGVEFQGFSIGKNDLIGGLKVTGSLSSSAARESLPSLWHSWKIFGTSDSGGQERGRVENRVSHAERTWVWRAYLVNIRRV